jgi:hypothetical protein
LSKLRHGSDSMLLEKTAKTVSRSRYRRKDLSR